MMCALCPLSDCPGAIPRKHCNSPLLLPVPSLSLMAVRVLFKLMDHVTVLFLPQTSKVFPAYFK